MCKAHHRRRGWFRGSVVLIVVCWRGEIVGCGLFAATPADPGDHKGRPYGCVAEGEG